MANRCSGPAVELEKKEKKDFQQDLMEKTAAVTFIYLILRPTLIFPHLPNLQFLPVAFFHLTECFYFAHVLVAVP